MGLRPTQGDENGFRSATALHGSVALPFVIPTGVVMGLRPTQGDEKRLLSSNRSLWNRRPPLCHPERSRGICSSADLSWKCFSTERSAVEGSAVLLSP